MYMVIAMSKSGPKYLKLETENLAEKNIDKIASLFPNVLTELRDDEGNLKKGIDFDRLRQELSCEYVEGREERYEFTWVGKKKSVYEANRPIRKTLRPCLEESKDWDRTENIYIEGDNLDALKLLQESYLHSIKMIYLDPPYNTGNDFLYNDKFVMDIDDYDEEIGIVDECGNRMFKNRKERGRYHSDWCSMIYPRLKIAHTLLTDDGVIFVSIDDNEVHNLRKIMDEIFGETNFVEQFIWNSGRTASSIFTREHEYVVAYAKNKEIIPLIKYEGDSSEISDRAVKKVSRKNPASDIFFPAGIRFEGKNRLFSDKFGDSEVIEVVRGKLECKDGKLANDVTLRAGWVMKDQIEGWISGCNVFDTKGQRVQEFFFKENGVLQYIKERGTVHPKTIIQDIKTKQGTNELMKFFGVKVFDYPKPIGLIEFFSQILNEKNEIILDFFAGSSPTAHAVFNMNMKDGGKRKFIAVQLPESCEKGSEALKAGFMNISEIGKERIRRAGEQIRQEIEEENRLLSNGEEQKPVPDIGFRVFKIDDTNMKDVYYSPSEYSQETIEGLVDNVKPDRTDLDLLYQVLLDWGLPLDLKHEIEEVNGYKIHIVDNDSLVACFESNVSEDVMRIIASKKPLRAIFRDGAFSNSPGKLNIEGIFKTIAPDTKVRVI